MKQVFLILFCCTILSCEKDNGTKPELPEATTAGRNTMGCYVNGIPHSYSGHSDWNHPNGVSFSLITTPFAYANFSGGNSEAPGDIHVFLYGSNFHTNIAYQELTGFVSSTSYNHQGKGIFEVKANDQFNYVKFTRLDESVAAGIFQFKCYLANDTDSVIVTNGRFDIAR